VGDRIRRRQEEEEEEGRRKKEEEEEEEDGRSSTTAADWKMKRINIHNQASKVGLATPVRAPVNDEDHPLGSPAAASSPDSFLKVQVHTDSTEAPAPGLQTRSQIRTPT
jgi:hypothetical protein